MMLETAPTALAVPAARAALTGVVASRAEEPEKARAEEDANRTLREMFQRGRVFIRDGGEAEAKTSARGP